MSTTDHQPADLDELWAQTTRFNGIWDFNMGSFFSIQTHWEALLRELSVVVTTGGLEYLTIGPKVRPILKVTSV